MDSFRWLEIHHVTKERTGQLGYHAVIGGCHLLLINDASLCHCVSTQRFRTSWPRTHIVRYATLNEPI